MCGVKQSTSESLVARTDAQLMQGVANGEAECLGVLYERYARMVKMAIGRFIPWITEADREELVQDIFIALNDSAVRFPMELNLRAWLYGIIANKARKWRRNTWLHRRLLSERAEQGVGMALRTNVLPEEKANLRELISKGLKELSENLRDVFLLHAIEGFSGEEISRILGIQHRTVRTRLHRARRQLCRYLDESGLFPELGKEG
jgi:RNA polymerase sigma-70 factor (ECF subfamily)